MGYVEGRLLICDQCGKREFCAKTREFFEGPGAKRSEYEANEGWRKHANGVGLLCAECNAKFLPVKEAYDAKLSSAEEEFKKEVNDFLSKRLNVKGAMPKDE